MPELKDAVLADVRRRELEDSPFEPEMSEGRLAQEVAIRSFMLLLERSRSDSNGQLTTDPEQAIRISIAGARAFAAAWFATS